MEQLKKGDLNSFRASLEIWVFFGYLQQKFRRQDRCLVTKTKPKSKKNRSKMFPITFFRCFDRTNNVSSSTGQMWNWLFCCFGVPTLISILNDDPLFSNRREVWYWVGQLQKTKLSLFLSKQILLNKQWPDAIRAF